MEWACGLWGVSRDVGGYGRWSVWFRFSGFDKGCLWERGVFLFCLN